MEIELFENMSAIFFPGAFWASAQNFNVQNRSVKLTKTLLDSSNSL